MAIAALRLRSSHWTAIPPLAGLLFDADESRRSSGVGHGQAVLSDNIADAESATTKFAQNNHKRGE
jgi:hypothetical protein